MSNNKCIVFKFKTRWVDLGLPSGTKWARMNVGATNPEDAGLYFSWGNVDGHAEGSEYDFSQTVYDGSSGSLLTVDIPANATYDAARANFGDKAKMPTKDQFVEMTSNCTSEWVTVNGVNGIRFTSNINGNSIFLPASGFYDHTTLHSKGSAGLYFSGSYFSSTRAYRLSFDSSEISADTTSLRTYGFSVRAVM